LSRDGTEFLKFGLGVWGPAWAWTGIEGNVRGENGVAAGRLSAKIEGKVLKLDFSAKQTATNSLQLSYKLHTDSEVDLTMFVVEVGLGKVFKNYDALVETQGKTIALKMPFGKGEIERKVQSLKLTDALGAETVLCFDPPCDIESDGSARIQLAKGHLATGTVQLTVNVQLPRPVQWYSGIAELPDEPGVDKWYPWRGTGIADDSALSMRNWIERPAGKHGRIKRQGDHLVYDGSPIKLWGVNLCYGTCAPEKSLAEKRSNFYVNQGINAVRLHKFADNTGWSGIQARNTCVEYDSAGLDRMDYQVAKFKESGIYIDLSAHFGTLKLGPGDRELVPFLDEFGLFRDGRIELPHSAVFYSPELQHVQILQMVNLLKHRNPYTDMTYAEDPVIAFVEIINEQSILFYSSPEPLKVSATLRKQVAQRFCQWLREKYGTQEKLVGAWGKAAFDCFAGDGFKTEGENLDKNNILPIGNPWYWDPDQIWGSQGTKRVRLLDTLEFLYGLQTEFYDHYVKAMRAAGYKGEIIGSNWQAGRGYSHFANLYSDALVGTIDRHNYFAGDLANATMLAHAGSGILSSGMQQVEGRPFMLSEWIHEFPLEYGLEGPALISAYGLGLQGWDASFMFQNGDSGSLSDQIGRDRWDVTAPQIMGLFPAITRQIYRGDIKQSRVVAVRKVHVPSLFEGKLGFDDKVVQGYDAKELDSSKVSARAMAAVKSVIEFTDSLEPTPTFDMKPYEKDGEIVSSSGQLRWREANAITRGAFTIESSGTCAIIGFNQGHSYQLGSMNLEAQSPFCVVYVTALEKKESLDSSRTLLITALARARNTNMKYSPSGERMLSKGQPPILMEPVKVTLTFKRKGSPTVFLLDHNGKQTGETLSDIDGKLTLDGARDKTPYYLVKW